jgi:hypothetical protein
MKLMQSNKCCGRRKHVRVLESSKKEWVCKMSEGVSPKKRKKNNGLRGEGERTAGSCIKITSKGSEKTNHI